MIKAHNTGKSISSEEHAKTSYQQLIKVILSSLAHLWHSVVKSNDDLVLNEFSVIYKVSTQQVLRIFLSTNFSLTNIQPMSQDQNTSHGVSQLQTIIHLEKFHQSVFYTLGVFSVSVFCGITKFGSKSRCSYQYQSAYPSLMLNQIP